jgi:branched-chain amino acid transport system permease protein
VQTSQGALERAIPNPIPGGIKLMQQGSFVVQLTWMQIAIIVVTLVTLGVFTYMVTRTPLGRAMRAVEQDAKMAALLGIDTNRTISYTFIIGSALAAVAGVMFLMYYGDIDFYIGFNAGIKAFTAAVLGGIGSLPGAVLGGLLIGLIEAFWSGYATLAYKDVAVYSILAIVLMFMPTGLLGRNEIEKV